LSSDYILTCNPIYSPSIGIIGKILVLNEIKRAKTLVTKMVGAKANFEFGNIIGKNKKFLKAVQQAQIASNSNSNILLLGESGTGKDVFAQAIHNASERAKKPFVAINCAAIPRDLIASELFGYEEGAFTGSVRGGKNGKFELADGGTIFLDEIAEIPLETQAVLLRVLEDKTISRLGSSFVRSVNVRIIAATNKNLHDEVQKRRFREDLYYRLNILSIHLVPLRERSDDIPLLLDHFLKNFRSIIGKKIVKIDPRVFEFLYSYNWPGNIREFQNVVERMVHYARGNELTIDLIPEEILYYVKADNRKDTPTFEATISTLEAKRDLTSSFNNIRLLHEQKERDFIIKMLNLDVKKKVLALEMGISRTTLYRMIKRYKISD
jgi:transcriptional regulator with PAS, ATPase and Fis domain